MLTGSSGLRRRDEPAFSPHFAPGRIWLELSVILAALAIIVPVLGVGAMGFAMQARAAGNRRWLAALLASAWCLALGVAIRGLLGQGLVP